MGRRVSWLEVDAGHMRFFPILSYLIVRNLFVFGSRHPSCPIEEVGDGTRGNRCQKLPVLVVRYTPMDCGTYKSKKTDGKRMMLEQ